MQLHRGTAAGAESSTPFAANITATSYVDSSVVNGTKYFYKVAAVNTAGTSALSSEVSATPQVSAPAAPTGLTASPGNARVTLKWTASSGAKTYNVYRGTSAGAESPTPVATGITSTSYASSGLTNGKTYFFRVAAVDAGGTSALSNEASATPKK